MKKTVLFFSVMLWISASFAQLTGTYTVYGTSPDYATIQAACTDLETLGQSGPVIFNIRDGSYAEVVTLNSVAGNSVTNTITFQSENTDSTLVTIVSSTGNTFTFTDVNYVNFNDIGISFNGLSGEAVRFNNGGNGSVFDHAAISYSLFNGSYAVYVDRDAGVNDFKFKNSSINSMSGGLYLYSEITNVNNFTIDNSIISANKNGIEIYAEKFANNASILNSDISATSGSGVEFSGYYSGADNLTILNSKLSSYNNYAFYGYSEYNMNNGLINNSEFLSEIGKGFYLGVDAGSVSDWTVTNSKFKSLKNAFYIYSDLSVSNMTFFNDSMIVNIGGMYTGYGDALYLEGNSMLQNIDIHDNYFFTDSANYGGYAVQLEAGDGSLINLMCYDNEVKSEYGFSIESDAVGKNWWIDNNNISARYYGMDLDLNYGSGSEIVITNNNIETALYDGIHIDSDGPLHDMRLDSNIIISGDESIYLQGYGGLNDVYVRDNQITSLTDDGLTIKTDAAMFNIEINGNTIVSNDVAIYIDGEGGLSNITIDNNMVDSEDNGIYLYTDATVGNTTITYNTLNTFNQAIYIEGYYGGIDGITLDNNFAYSQADEGIFMHSYSTVSNVNITNNEVYGDTVNCCDAAIYIESDDANMENVIVTNNEAYSYYYGIYLEAYSGNGTNCKVSNNDVWAGEYGVYFEGAGSGSEISFNNIYPIYTNGTQTYSGIYAYGYGGPNTGMKISNNYIDNTNGYGIEAYYYNDLIIENNEIKADGSDNSLYGIYLENISGQSRINANKILANSEYRGIKLEYGNGTNSSPIIISNNFVSGFETSFEITYSSYVDLIHNSVSSPVNSRMVRIEGMADMKILNNIFKSSNTSGDIYWSSTSNANINVDYNAYNFDSTLVNMSVDNYFGTNASLYDFQSNTGMDANSLNADPMFINDTLDLHIPCSNSALTAGTLTSVIVDVDGSARNLATPTIGAHEIAPATSDFLADSTYMCVTTDLLSSATGIYLWSTAETTQIITVNTVGTYYCTVTDGCGNVSYDSIMVWTNNPIADFAWGLNGYQAVFSNTSAGGTTYSWDFGDGNTSTDMNPIHFYGPDDASYTVVLTVTNECGGIETSTQIVTVSNLSIEKETLESRGFNVFPNPTQGNITIDFALLLGENITVYLIDVNGRIVYSDMINNEVGAYQKQINLSDLSNGMYFLRIDTENESLTKRVIKQ